jgi:DNA-directed RNA polymerase subunit alpha
MNKSGLIALIKPKRIEKDKNGYSPYYGKFICEPLEKGYGITIGNALRRILLSSIEGTAITSVRIEGVSHPFSTIPGVLEDVTEIILNLKQVRLKLYAPPPRTIRIEKQGSGEIRAGSIVTDGTVEIVNPDQHIATLTSEEAKLFMEMTVKLGRAYMPAELTKEKEQSVEEIPVSAIFSPIKRVNFTVRNARVGQVIDYDKLIFEVWTDGTITPERAVFLGAKILTDQLEVFLREEEVSSYEMVEEKQKKEEIPKKTLYMSIDELELSPRALNCLKNANIHLVGELVQKTEDELLKIKNLGRKSLNEVKNVLQEKGLDLGLVLPNFSDSELLGKMGKAGNYET